MSNFFDPKDKKNAHILSYFDNKTWLIVDNASGTRISIKKTITQFGVRTANVIDADNYKDAVDAIRGKRPNFVITNKTINKGSGTDLFDIHLEVAPNRLVSGFYVISDEISQTEIALALDFEMDGLISLPFTGQTIIDTVLASVKNKIAPTTYSKQIEEGRAQYLIGELDRAKTIFKEALVLSKKPYEVHYFLGQIHFDQKEFTEAIKELETSILYNADHYKSLSKLSTLYFEVKDFKKAYNINALMTETYPVAPKRIPELIKLSIINRKYEDIANYLKIINKIETPPSVEVQQNLSAGMVILSKFFFGNNDRENGIEALKEAFKYSNGKYEILKSIAQSFEENKNLNILLELFRKTETSAWPASAKGLYFHVFNQQTENDTEVVQFGEKLLKEKVKDVVIYKDLIGRAIKMKRKLNYIESLALEGMKYFPDSKDEFEGLVENAKLVVGN